MNKQQPRIWINTKSTEFQHKNRTKFPNKTNVWSNHLIHAQRIQTDIEQQLNAHAALTNKTVKPFSRDKLCISKVFINFALAINECELFLLFFSIYFLFKLIFGKDFQHYRHQQEYELLFVMKLLMKELCVEKPKLNILHDLDYFPNFNCPFLDSKIYFRFCFRCVWFCLFCYCSFFYIYLQEIVFNKFFLDFYLAFRSRPIWKSIDRFALVFSFIFLSFFVFVYRFKKCYSLGFFFVFWIVLF